MGKVVSHWFHFLQFLKFIYCLFYYSNRECGKLKMAEGDEETAEK